MIVNEILQWAVLLFIAMFVLGLTRQLGRALHLRDLQAPAVPPVAVGDRLSAALFSQHERAAVSELLAAAGSAAAVVAVMSEGCGGCETLLAGLEQRGVPAGLALVAITQEARAHADERLDAAFDLVLHDPLGARSRAAGVHVTPTVLVVDRSWTVQHVDSGGDVRAAVESWRARIGAPSLPEHVGRPGGAVEVSVLE